MRATLSLVLAALLGFCLNVAAAQSKSTEPAASAKISCPCSGSKVCIGRRGGRYCITSGGKKRYVK